MKLSLIILFIISAVFNQSIFNHAPLRSNVLEDYKNENKELDSDKNKNKYNFPYVLGPGDKLFIRFLGLAELSGDYTIGVDGYLDMPLIDELYVEDLTLEELNKNLDIKYAKYLKSVNIKAKIVSYRPIRVYVMGEVARPGLRTLTGTTTLISGPRRNLDNEDDLNFDINNSYSIQPSTKSLNSEINFPTVFDALKASNGITPYTDLSEIIVLRNEPESKGGGKLQAKLNFIDLFIKGDQSQNIRIFDGDTIIVKASEKIISEQFNLISKTNINPFFIDVFVGGSVANIGKVKLPQGSSLNQALALSGGPLFLSGKVEFMRFKKSGEVEKRVFSYSKDAKISSLTNPVLMNGDIINIRTTVLRRTTEFTKEISAPILGIYSLFNIFD